MTAAANVQQRHECCGAPAGCVYRRPANVVTAETDLAGKAEGEDRTGGVRCWKAELTQRGNRDILLTGQKNTSRLVCSPR